MSDYNSGSGSKTSTALVTILGIGLVLLLLCCGGAYWVGKKAYDKIQTTFSSDPAQIRTMTASIVDITIPEEFPPLLGMDWTTFNVPMKMVMYGTQDQRRSLMLMQMANPNGQGMMTKEEFEQAINQQAAQGGGQVQMQQLNVTESEKWIFDIAGEEYTFEMATGTDPARNVPAKRLAGVLPGKDGAAFLSLMTNADDWDEEAALKMIESTGATLLRKEAVGEPGSETPAPGEQGDTGTLPESDGTDSGTPSETDGDAAVPAESGTPAEPVTP